jgi:hypothetical protein
VSREAPSRVSACPIRTRRGSRTARAWTPST